MNRVVTPIETPRLPAEPRRRTAIATRGESERVDPVPSSHPALRRLLPLMGLAVATLALLALRRELRAYRYADVMSSLRELPLPSVLLAVALTAVAYAVLVGYDALALRYAGRRLSTSRMALASFIAYAFSHNVGLSSLTGASLRYRCWTSWGISAEEVARGVAFTSTTLWVGMAAVGGATLLLSPAGTGAEGVMSLLAMRLLGVLLVGALGTYLLWSASPRRSLTVRGWTVPSPGPRLALAQVVVSGLDWLLAASVLYVLLPASPALSPVVFLRAFMVAQLIGMVSHVPGGVGVFESLIVLLLHPFMPASEVLGALLGYRLIYYLLPFAAGAVALVGYELAGPRNTPLSRVARTAGRWVPSVMPHVLGAATFMAGVVLLFSGATPSVSSRVRWLDAVLPLGVIEISHLAGTLAGAGLIVLAWGLRRRLDAAYALAAALLGVGIVASLLKGLDWEEALVLAGVLGLLLPSRRHFYRKAALTNEWLSPAWLGAIVFTIGASIWLGFFSFAHVQYSHHLWWQFTARGDAPRFLRSTLVTLGTLGVLGLMRVLRHARTEPRSPTPAEMARMETLAAEAPYTMASLALLGDKALLFSDSGRGVLMYGVSGRSWVALGDPVGPPADQVELAWRFREMADRAGAWPVFYEVDGSNLPLYVDLGLTLLKVGEEARIPLASFSLEGSNRKGLRRTLREGERFGARLEVVPPREVPRILPELRRVSDAWLATRRTREKGFSLGFFSESYLSRFPVALIMVEDRIVAFANLLVGAERHELSVDLMRYAPAAPRDAMELLFIRLILWAKAEGYEWFNLGMAPFSGFESRALVPLWHRLGALVFRHGEHFYHFQGLRHYKAQFDPCWRPKYLASPGGVALPRILTNVASLISGGVLGVMMR